MYELDKERFGSFVAGLRKEKGLTQKELALRVHVTDKAVSKWERGLSIPDVALLVPLAEVLGVSVTELLECRRVDLGGLSPQQIEELVQRAVSLADTEPERRLHRQNLRLWVLGLALAAAEVLCLLVLDGPGTILTGGVGLVTLLCGVFSGFFWLYTREKLPRYYDENPISAFSDGPLRMNLPGMTFNNRNWPHILRFLRWWSLGSLWLSPFLWLAGSRLLPDFWTANSDKVLTLAFVLSLLPSLWWIAKKYE